MKRSILTLFSVLLSTLLVACNGTGNEPAPEEPTPGNTAIVISASASTVSLGSEITFTVAMNGADVTSESTIVNTTGGSEVELPAGTNTYAASAAGTYTFRAKYNGEMSGNEVSVVYGEPSKQFYRRHALFRATGSWCPWCPMMSDAVHAAEVAEPGKYQDIALHYEYPGDAQVMMSAASSALITELNPSGFPTLYIDYNSIYTLSNSSASASSIKTISGLSEKGNPTAAGIKLVTAMDASNQVTVDVEMTFTESDEYKLCVALLVDGFNFPQKDGNITDPNYIQSNVLYAFLQSSTDGENIGAVNMGDVVTKSYTYDFSSVTSLPEGTTYKIAAWVKRVPKSGSKYTVNNIATCALGETLDYVYAE